MPLPGKPGSAERQARAKAWRSAIKQHAKAQHISLAIAGDDDANAKLNGEASFALQRAQSEKRAVDGHTRPRGSAPDGYAWDDAAGQWLDGNGVPRPDATRNQRRVQQRNASEVQTLRHKHKWEHYESCERRYRWHRSDDPFLTAQEQKAVNAGWRLAVLSPDRSAALGRSPLGHTTANDASRYRASLTRPWETPSPCCHPRHAYCMRLAVLLQREPPSPPELDSPCRLRSPSAVMILHARRLGTRLQTMHHAAGECSHGRGRRE